MQRSSGLLHFDASVSLFRCAVCGLCILSFRFAACAYGIALFLGCVDIKDQDIAYHANSEQRGMHV